MKFVKVFRKNFFYFTKDLALLITGIVVFCGTVIFLQRFYHDKEAQALNILLTAFVSRVTGREFLEIARLKLKRFIHMYMHAIYKQEFVNYE